MANRKRRRPHHPPTTDVKAAAAREPADGEVAPADDAPADAAKPTDLEPTEPEPTEPEPTDPEPEPEPEPERPADDLPAGPVSPRTGWVIAAFFLFWPLAVPALFASVRASEANGAGRLEEARRQSLRTLDLSLSAVCVGGFGLLAVVLAIALAPTYITPGMAARAEAYVPGGLLQAVTGYPPSTGSATGPTPVRNGIPGGTTAGDGQADTAPDAYLGATTEGGAAGDAPAGGGVADGTGAVGPVDPDGTEIQDLEVNDCFETDGLDDAAVLYTVRVVPCSAAHGAEVFGATTVPADLAAAVERPDRTVLADAAHEYCLPLFEDFVGVPYGVSPLTYWPILPSEESWADDDRRLTCVLESAQDVRGSQEDSGR